MSRHESQQDHGGRAGRQHRPPLPVRAIIGSAARAGRYNAGRILIVAIAVSTATSAVEIAVHSLADQASVPVTITADLGASGVSLLGVVFLSGFLSQIVGETGHGRRRARVRDILRKLQWRRLILADLAVVGLFIIGLIAFVIPGLIVINLLAVVGPVVEIENRPVGAALRRSAHLVRQHFWTVALLATLPVTIADEVTSAKPHSTGPGALLAALAIRGVAGAVIESVLGLVLAELCYRLIEVDRQGSPATSPGSPGSPADRGDGPPHSRPSGHGARPLQLNCAPPRRRGKDRQRRQRANDGRPQLRRPGRAQTPAGPARPLKAATAISRVRRLAPP